MYSSFVFNTILHRTRCGRCPSEWSLRVELRENDDYRTLVSATRVEFDWGCFLFLLDQFFFFFNTLFLSEWKTVVAIRFVGTIVVAAELCRTKRAPSNGRHSGKGGLAVAFKVKLDLTFFGACRLISTHTSWTSTSFLARQSGNFLLWGHLRFQVQTDRPIGSWLDRKTVFKLLSTTRPADMLQRGKRSPTILMHWPLYGLLRSFLR